MRANFKMIFVLILLAYTNVMLANSETISFSGRLVQATGAPVVGPVDLTFKIFVDEGGPKVEKCSLAKTGVALSNGIFNVTLDYGTTCLTNTRKLSEIIEAAYYNSHVPYIRTIDNTNSKTYPDQPIRAVPLAVHALTGGNGNYNLDLEYASCSDGQVLKMNSSGNFACAADDNGAGGTVTSIGTGNGLTGGPITGSGTIDVDFGTSDGQVPSITSGKIASTLIPNLDGAIITTGTIDEARLPTANTSTNGKLTSSDWNLFNNKQDDLGTGSAGEYLGPGPAWATLNTQAVAEHSSNLYFTDARAKASAVADAISDGVTDVAPSQNAVFDALATKADASGNANIVADSITLDTQGAVNLNPYSAGAGNTSELRFYELSTNGSNYTGFKSPDSLAANNIYTLPPNGGSTNYVLGLANSVTGELSWMDISTASGVSNTGDLIINADSDSDNAGEVVLQTKGSDRLVIDNDGNVGIGSVSPGSKFHVDEGLSLFSNTSNHQAMFLDTEVYGYIEAKYTDDTNGYVEIGAWDNVGTVGPRNLVLQGTGGNVGIGTSSPEATALLDVASTTKGFLGPRMTTAQRNAITTPATGLQVYNTTTNAINYYNGSSWQELGIAGSGVTSISAGTGLDGGTITSTGTISIANDGVTATQLANNAVDTAAIVDANVTTAKLADDAVTTAKITDANVTTAKLADDSVTAAKLAAGAVDSTALGANSVATGNIVDGTIVNADISATAAIDYSKLDIADGDLTVAKTSGLQTALDSKLSLDGSDTMTGDLQMGTNNIVIEGGTSGAVTLAAAAAVTDYSFIFPATAGTSGQVLVSNGAGNATSWTTVNTSDADGHSLDAADGSPTDVVYVDNDGNVGVGTTSPETELHVDGGASWGQITVHGELGPGIRLKDTNAPANAKELLIRSEEGKSLFMTINDGGGVQSIFQTIDNLTGAIAVGTSATTPNSSTAILEIASSTKGFLGPRMTTAQRDAISAPATGLQVYNTTTNAINYYNGSSWQALGIAGSGITSVTAGTGLDGGTITSTGTISIANDGVTATQLANNAVDTAAIVDANVTTAKLANDAVTTAKITDANVTTTKLADDSVTAAKLAAGAVDSAALGTNSVATGNIVDGTITNADISGTAAIAYSKLNISDGDLTVAKTSGLQTALDSKVDLAGDTMTGDLAMNGSSDITMAGSTSGVLTLDASATTSSYTWTFPANSGTNGYVLATDGSGTTSWIDSSGFTTVAAGSGGSIQFNDGSNGFTADAANLHWDDTNNRLGIGTNSPSSTFEVDSTDTSTTPTTLGHFSLTLNPSSPAPVVKTGVLSEIIVEPSNSQDYNITLGAASRIFHDGSGTITDSRGFNAVSRNRSSGTMTSSQGLQAASGNDSTGNIVESQAIVAALSNSSTGTITNARGLQVAPIYNPSGTITNTYGVYVGDITAGTQTNTPFSFYAEDPNAYSYFAGNVGIGTTSPSHPMHISKSVSGENTTLDEIALRVSNPIGSLGSGGEYAQTGIGFGRDDTVRSGIVTGTYGWDYMDFYVGSPNLVGSPKIHINGDAAGNVGIGLDAPTSKLHVDGDVTVTTGNDICIAGGNCLSAAGVGSGDMTAVNTNSGSGLSGGSTSGDATLQVVVDDSTVEIATNTIQVKDDGITSSKLASGAVDSTALGTNSVATGNIVDGTITNADISGTAAIAYSKLNIADGNLTIAKTSGLQAALDSKVDLGGDTMTGDLAMNSSSDITMAGSTSGVLTLDASATTSSYTWTFPANGGTNGYVLATDGSGTTSWVDSSGFTTTAAGSAGSIQFNDGSNGFAADAANLHWDDTNNRLGIGTASPLVSLSVIGPDVGDNLSDEQTIARFASDPSTSNSVGLEVKTVRHTAGTAWNGTSSRLQRKVDVTDQAFIDFGIEGVSGNSGLGFGTGTTPETKMVIEESGDVGMGTTTPQSSLEVVSTYSTGTMLQGILSTRNSTDYQAPIIGSLKTRGTYDTPTAVKQGDALIALRSHGHDGSKVVVTGDILMRAEEDFTATESGTSMTFRTATTGTQTLADRMHITGQGHVGIGTNNPNSRLSVRGGTDDVRVNITSSGGSVGVIDTVADGTWGTGRWLSINPSGANVGIGMLNPSSKLHVDGDVTVTTGNDICIAGGNCLSAAGVGTGDMTAVNTNSGSGLSGGATSGAATLQVVVDDSTVEIATNTIQVKDDGITSAKLAAGAVDSTALGANSVATGNIVDGTIVNADISGTAAIAYSKLNIADGDLTVAKTSGLQTALDAKLPLAGGTMTGDISMSNNDVLGLASIALDGATLGTVTVQAPLSVTDYTWQFPTSSGSNGQVLATDGTGATSWTTVNTSSADGHSLDAADGAPTNVVYVDNDGKVGVGTTSPSTTLHVEGLSLIAPASSGATANGNANDLVIENNTNAGISILSPDADYSQLRFGSPSNTTGGKLFYQYGDGSAPKFEIGTSDTNGVLVLEAGNANEIVNILPTGNVGIGTASPTRKLSVRGTNSYPLQLHRDQASAGVGIDFALDNASGAVTNYASIFGSVETSTAGAENGALLFETQTTGSSTEKMRITSAGNIGVGTTSPQNNVHIHEDSAGFSNLQFTNSDTGQASVTSGARVGLASNEDFLFVNNTTGKSIGFWTEETARMTIKNDGKVGIGTTSPASTVQVSSGGHASSTPKTYTGYGAQIGGFFDGYQLDNTGGWARFFDIGSFGHEGSAGSNLRFLTQQSGGTEVLERMRITSSGSIGVKTSSPDTSFHMADDASHLKVGDGTDALSIAGVAPTIRAHSALYNTAIIAKRDGASNAEVGIRADTLGTLGTFNNRPVSIVTNNTARIRINTDGNVGIGTDGPSTKLQVNGDVTADNYYNTSDRNYKKDIEQLQGSLEKLLEINGVRYLWRQEKFPEKKFNDGYQIGLIAQNVERMFPELVRTNADGYKSVRYANMVAIIIEAIKEQQKLIVSNQESNSREIASVKDENLELKTKVQYLEEKNKELESRLKKIEKAIGIQ